MAKGGYFVICYKEDLPKFGLTMEDLVLSIQKQGGEMAYILHDLDGVKPHYHLLCCWKSNPMPWVNSFKHTKKGVRLLRLGFLCWMRQHACLCPFTDSHGKEYKYHYDTALMRDVDACLHYMTHEP